LVDHVALQVQGKTAVQLSVPLLDPLPGYDSPDYSATAASALPGKPSLLTAFVLRSTSASPGVQDLCHHERAPQGLHHRGGWQR
jgi:hypothetical protein